MNAVQWIICLEQASRELTAGGECAVGVVAPKFKSVARLIKYFIN